MLLLAAAGWGIWRLVAGPDGVTATGPEPRESEPPLLETRGHTSILWHERDGVAVKTCEVKAKRFSVSADGRTRLLEGITDAVFFQDGRAVARAQAGRAVQDLTRNELQVEGGVRVRLEDGRARVTSDSAHWSAAEQRLTFPKPLLMTGPDASRFRAARAEVDARARHVQLRAVNGVVGNARIASPSCDYRLSDHTLVMAPLDYRAPGVQLRLGRARLDTHARIFHGDQMTMKANVRDLARSGGAMFASATLAALAAAAPVAPTGKPGEAKKTSLFEIVSVGKTSGQPEKFLLLEKNVHLRHRETDFYAERIELTLEEREPRVAVATGNARAVDSRNTVTGEKFTIYFKERRVVVENNVKVVTRPKEKPAGAAESTKPAEEKSLRDRIKGETTVTAQRLEYDYRRKNLDASGNLKCVNKGRTLTADRLTFIDKTEELVLTGTIRWVDEKGTEIQTTGPLKMTLTEGAETIEINSPLTGKFLIKEDETDEEPTEPPKAAAAANP
jgi:lipopolysaccharide export system protein LptA